MSGTHQPTPIDVDAAKRKYFALAAVSVSGVPNWEQLCTNGMAWMVGGRVVGA